MTDIMLMQQSVCEPHTATCPVPAGPARAPADSDRPIRVCYLIDELNTAGTETQLVALIRNLDPTRVRPYLCLLRGEGPRSRALEPPGCPVTYLGVRALCRPSTVRRVFRFARFLRRERIDVLQVYFADSTYFGVLAGTLARVPHLVRTRNNLGYWMTPLHRRLGKFCNRFASATIANSQPCRDALLADEAPNPESVVVLENGVDLARFPRDLLARAPGPSRRVGMMANLRPVKAPEIFLRAAAEVASTHDVIFEIAGEGELRPLLDARAAELGLGERFRLPGVVTDVPAFLARLDVAVLCSHSEGMSNALLEYMAAGRPIVATAVGANGQLIEHGVHGLLVPPGNPTQLAQAIKRLLDDPALAARLGGAARRRVEERYSRGAMVRRFETFYRRLVFPASTG